MSIFNNRIPPHDLEPDFDFEYADNIPDDAEESLAEWFRSLSFEDAWTLAGAGNKEATEEILRRQWEYWNETRS